MRWLIFLHELGIELPSYSDDYATVADVRAIRCLVDDARSGSYDEVPRGEEQVFDAALMRVGRDCVHVGTVVGRGLLLHVQPGKVSCVASYRSGSALCSRVAGFYRLQVDECPDKKYCRGKS